MANKLTDITVTMNSDYDNKLFLEEYETATADWTEEERAGLPVSEIASIFKHEFSDGSVEYIFKIKE